MRYPKTEAKTAIVTGCSSGIGLATAHMLRARGWSIVATARKSSDLDALRAEGFDAVEMEMTDPESVESGFRRALEFCGGKIGALVNNAGYGQPGALEDLERDQLRMQFEVNVIGLQHLTNLCIPHFRRQNYGRIVNVSSVLGRITMPFMGAYCASKHALESLSDALRVELADAGVAIVLVEPGPIKTRFSESSYEKLRGLTTGQSPFHVHYEEEGRRYASNREEGGRFMLPPESVAKKIVSAIECSSPKRRYKVTVLAYYGAFMRRFAPDALLDFTFIKYWKGKGSK